MLLNITVQGLRTCRLFSDHPQGTDTALLKFSIEFTSLTCSPLDNEFPLRQGMTDGVYQHATQRTNMQNSGIVRIG